MCYLCIKDNPFAPANEGSSTTRKRARMLEIKRLLGEAERNTQCSDGQEAVERLKQEQYSLSREL